MSFNFKSMLARRAFMKTSFAGALALPAVSSASLAFSAPAGSLFNVRDFIAADNGATLVTNAINKAIEACSAAGGGTVYFPAGTYQSGSIRLKSNITLHFDAGATLLGAPNDINAYDLPEDNPFDMYQDFGHSHWHNSLIWGEGLENIAITGRGLIVGAGGSIDESVVGAANKTIALKLCKNIAIKDITIRDAGHFAVLPTGCDNMIIDGVTVDSNVDGINLDCCRNVRVSNCSINTPIDNALCLKTSYALGEKRVTENVTITNCLLSGFAEGSLLDGSMNIKGSQNGGIKFGTESNGDFRNVVISNCVFDACDNALTIGTADGGTIENVTVSNITMRNNQGAPIFIRLANRGRGPGTPSVGKIRDINISNVFAKCSYREMTPGWPWRVSSHITGIPGHPVENVSLSNIKIIYDGAGTKEDAASVPPDKEQAFYHLDATLPAYGFFLSHARGIAFRNVRVGFEKEDKRPALYCEDVDGLELDNFKAERAADGEPSVVLKNVRNMAKGDFDG